MPGDIEDKQMSTESPAQLSSDARTNMPGRPVNAGPAHAFHQGPLSRRCSRQSASENAVAKYPGPPPTSSKAYGQLAAVASHRSPIIAAVSAASAIETAAVARCSGSLPAVASAAVSPVARTHR